VLISTMNDLPGYEIEEVLGEVFGLTVRSRNLGSQIGASFKSLVGGELKGMTKMLAEGRDHATERLIENARGLGADAVLAFRFDTSELGTTWTEICAYGTAVFVVPVRVRHETTGTGIVAEFSPPPARGWAPAPMATPVPTD
jgi:uncharacterized protein YbjQ (UPF0145 family)